MNVKLSDDPLWYKDAIIYEVRVRSFYDANGDGTGDFQGITAKLDYLQDLGITALWLLPFYPSPMRDDGYDTAAYTDVHPEVGTLADFEAFMSEAHRRGIRVITELVLNHTSDQHPWFQRARRALPGSPERNFYVWSDTTERYKEARIIFKDFEPSNWTWDPVAKAYYWHRFFAHQPDLNFENPEVQESLLAVVDFWFGLGVDGLRLDAVPYLYEAEGTNCENLDVTHAFLKKLRAHVDSKFKNRMLLAEANQWPEDAAAYFGKGDECHMNFHFPIMPRMFMSIHMEDRFPIIDILAQTPALDPSRQWALFLRNHDELTLEMVTDEERDTMYRAYARDQEMRLNLGIRRRLAPLVGNDRRVIELLNALLFSLPGTPVVYYGDEIGMGDNIFLGDRNGVRTPMQWSADRNAGFSRANPQRLILPINIDPEYHYESLNVEAQQNSTNSLLWWTKRIIALRKRSRAFGRGSIEFLSPSNARVLAFVREWEGETVLVVANLSRFVQFVELDLAKYKGTSPVELFGRTSFPVVGDVPYLLTLGGHAFYWFALEKPANAEDAARISLFDPPTIECSKAEALFAAESSALADALPSYLVTRKWFAGRQRVIAQVSIAESVPIATDASTGATRATIAIVRVEYAEGEAESYVLPFQVSSGEVSSDSIPRGASVVIANVHFTSGESPVKIVDLLEDEASSRILLDAIAQKRSFASKLSIGAIVASNEGAWNADEAVPDGAKNISADHANAAIVYGDRYLLKFLRRLEDGTSPELEVGRHLAARVPTLVPAIAGAIELRYGRREPMTLAVLERFVPNEGSALRYTREELGRFYERVISRRADEEVPILPATSLVHLAAETPPQAIVATMGAYLEFARLLGTRTAEMHRALADAKDDPAFTPEPYSTFDRRSLYQTLRNVTGTVLRSLRTRIGHMPNDRLAEQARQIAASEAQILKRFEPLVHERLSGLRIRCHGDYHLGQILYTGKDFVIIDFDGGRDRTLSERRRKRSPIRDVAGMLRSFHSAAFGVLGDVNIVREADHATAVPWAHRWTAWASASFLHTYLAQIAETSLVPHDEGQLALLLDAFVTSKLLQQLAIDLRDPTESIAIPLHGLAHIIGASVTEAK